MKPYIHAQNSAKKFGGKLEDYLDIHQFMDSSKAAMPDNRHRCLTHNAWFIGPGGPLEMAFGVVIINTDEKDICVRDVGEQHIIEDLGFIPTVQDYLSCMTYELWMERDKNFDKFRDMGGARISTWNPATKSKEDRNPSFSGLKPDKGSIKNIYDGSTTDLRGNDIEHPKVTYSPTAISD